jgi:hypothetical protein
MESSNYQDQYIKYLTQNVNKIDCKILESYILDKIDFQQLTEMLQNFDIISYKNFKKSKIINNFLDLD